MPHEINKGANGLAIVIGHLYGDGGISSKGRVYYCNTENFLIKEFVNSMNKIFKIKPWIKKEDNITRVVYPVSIGRALWDLFGKFSSGKDTKIITPQIQGMPLRWEAKMLQAWFNDDGSVSNIPPNYKVISIKQKLKHLIYFIKETLEKFDIKSHIIEDDGKWLLRICGYDNIIKFRDKVNFSIEYRKNKKLKEMIESIKRPHFIIKEKILKILKKSPKTRKELIKSLNINVGTLYGHLHGWKRSPKSKRKTNLGLIQLGSVKVVKHGRINKYVVNDNSRTPSTGFGYRDTSSGGSTGGAGGSCG